MILVDSSCVELPLKLKLLIEVGYKLLSLDINSHFLFLTHLVIFIIIIIFFFIILFTITNQETLSGFTT
ncbi:hypothetical protein HanXRQr2_Chr11g0496871 [Helianthus annuus]|uniref:Uncharacterized protein n=1 Tax=Helianthus annuus TaxID=4232 RepID=A0A9K3N0F8_HELAN|nr:hypothetical protein HanXRQr2_Chr11g0496871 [Helianthus annuus]KAJ0875653.1 hypothetical protein HanPSC8_Chr11g0478921 [Helianthus annuus]